jgi:hypothetical protein
MTLATGLQLHARKTPDNVAQFSNWNVHDVMSNVNSLPFAMSSAGNF